MLMRTLLVGTATAFIGLYALTGSALGSPLEPTGCTVASLPVFVDQGAANEASSIADIVEAHCDPVYAGSTVRIGDNELYDQCAKKLSWSAASAFAPASGPSYKATLDHEGNAIGALWGGPGCAPGDTLLAADLDAPPYMAAYTTFFVGGPEPTEPGLYALTPDGESSQVESEGTGAVATVLEVELPVAYAGDSVTIDAEALYDRCAVKTHFVAVGPDGKVKTGSHGVFKKVQLDNDGNAFVVLLGGESCAAGASALSATLEAATALTVTSTFTVLAPG